MKHKNQQTIDRFKPEDTLVWKQDDGTERVYVRIEAVDEQLEKKEEEVKREAREKIITMFDNEAVIRTGKVGRGYEILNLVLDKTQTKK